MRAASLQKMIFLTTDNANGFRLQRSMREEYKCIRCISKKEIFEASERCETIDQSGMNVMGAFGGG